MGTQSNDSLLALLNQQGMRVGNQVLNVDGSVASPSVQTWVDSQSKMAGGAQQPFALGASQSTITSALFTLSGKAQTGILTNTLVDGASVTTATKGGFVRVDVTDDNSIFVGSYYLEVFTLT